MDAAGILKLLQDLVASSYRVSQTCNPVASRSLCSRYSFCVVSVITTLMSGVICLRHSNVHFPQKHILLASCSREHTKRHSVGLLGQYYPWAKSALNSSHLSGMLEWVSSQLHLLRQVSITVKVYCILLRLKAIILQQDHVPLKVVEAGLSYFGAARSSRLSETEIWWDFSGILLTSRSYPVPRDSAFSFWCIFL